jgi:hypothetical protein
MLEIDKVSLPSVVYSVCCHFAAALRAKLVTLLCLQAFGERLRCAACRLTANHCRRAAT